MFFFSPKMYYVRVRVSVFEYLTIQNHHDSHPPIFHPTSPLPSHCPPLSGPFPCYPFSTHSVMYACLMLIYNRGVSDFGAKKENERKLQNDFFLLCIFVVATTV